MKKLTIINGEILLDGERIPCLKSFNIVSSTKDIGVAELTIRMDVAIGQDKSESERQ